jgi:hypothetical protein
MGRFRLNLGLHTLFGRLFLAMSILSIADVFLGVLFAQFFPVGYFSQKSITRIASDLAFVEGAVFFFVGALVAFFRSRLSSALKALMIIGVAMIGLSVVFGMLI